MTFYLSTASWKKMEGVHPDLIKVVELAIKKTPVDFMVLEGLRTPERQKQLFDSGASQTMNSRHLDGHAVDLGAIVGGHLTWKESLYQKIADAMLQAAAELKIPIIWGGSWVTLRDLDHFELNRKFYP